MFRKRKLEEEKKDPCLKEENVQVNEEQVSAEHEEESTATEEESTEDESEPLADTEPETETEAEPEPEAEVESEPKEHLSLEEAYCLGAGIEKETLDKAKEVLSRIAESVNNGSFKPEILRMALRLLNYDADIENARKKAMEEARREKITEAFANKRSAAARAAEIPHYSGTKGISGSTGNSIFDMARNAK